MKTKNPLVLKQKQLESLKIGAKKRKGALGNILSTSVCIIIILYFVVLLMDVSNILAYKDEVDMVARKYILILETSGTVSPTAVKTELQNLGYYNTNVVVNNGNSYPVGFSDTVTIEITVNATPDEIGLFNSNPLGNNIYTVHSKKQSISKARG